MPKHPAMEMSQGVCSYLRARYQGDLSWHPLFKASRELFAYLMEGV